jgi:hypothetical protein
MHHWAGKPRGRRAAPDPNEIYVSFELSGDWEYDLVSDTVDVWVTLTTPSALTTSASFAVVDDGDASPLPAADYGHYNDLGSTTASPITQTFPVGSVTGARLSTQLELIGGNVTFTKGIGLDLLAISGCNLGAISRYLFEIHDSD